jgi:hypothetical protein
VSTGRLSVPVLSATALFSPTPAFCRTTYAPPLPVNLVEIVRVQPKNARAYQTFYKTIGFVSQNSTAAWTQIPPEGIVLSTEFGYPVTCWQKKYIQKTLRSSWR